MSIWQVAASYGSETNLIIDWMIMGNLALGMTWLSPNW